MKLAENSGDRFSLNSLKLKFLYLLIKVFQNILPSWVVSWMYTLTPGNHVFDSVDCKGRQC